MTAGGAPTPDASASGIIRVRIRRYAPFDRAAIRAICCDTANRGEPLDPLLSDRELAADLLTRYYTDDDPTATWVAGVGGRVIGYLTGCLDTQRYEQLMSRRVVPQAVMEAIGRGALASSQAWRFVGAGLQTWVRGGFGPHAPLKRFPAHLHVNIRQGFRGQEVGRRLVERFVLQARTAGVDGVHARVRGDNPAACRFFEALGFRALRRHPVVWPDGAGYLAHEAVLYGRPLS